ncbi:MAG: GTPase [Planctomycetota bacterium]
MKPPTRVTVLTPPGRSAVAVIRVDGPAGVAAVEQHFWAANQKPLQEQPLDRIVFGRWCSDEKAAGEELAGEELIVCRVSPSAIEVHCHGGHAAVEVVVRDLVAAGCVRTPWQQAIEASALTAIEREAQTALAESVTDRTAAVLVDQLNGALASEVQAVAELLSDGRIDAAGERIARLHQRMEFGRHLTSPWRVVLAGPVNVGKSSLINALVGFERAVVFDEPGVTRDVVTSAAAIDGWPVELSDTAGLREATDEIEAAGVALAERAVASADLVVLVEAPGVEPIALPPSARVLRVANKADLGPPTPEGALPVSALTGAGIADLVAAIGAALVPDPPPPGAAVPFIDRHATLIARAHKAITGGRAEAAVAALEALLAGRQD